MQRLDREIITRSLASSRSQAENLVQLGLVEVNNKIITKPAQLVSPNDDITIKKDSQFVSRAALKLKSAAEKIGLSFKNLYILDVGSSTGGFTDYALKNGAKYSIAVDVGKNQLHPSLRGDNRIELHESTDIRSLSTPSLSKVNLVVIDVSFISLKEILPTIKNIVPKNTRVLAMLKPQFEAGEKLKNKGVIKNDTIRRKILKDFENWAKSENFIVLNKADSSVSGKKGNLERFYLLET